MMRCREKYQLDALYLICPLLQKLESLNIGLHFVDVKDGMSPGRKERGGEILGPALIPLINHLGLNLGGQSSLKSI